MHRASESFKSILDPQLEMFFGNQALKARLRSSVNNYRDNTVVDRFDFKIETVNLERAANRPQCRFDRLYHKRNHFAAGVLTPAPFKISQRGCSPPLETPFNGSTP